MTVDQIRSFCLQLPAATEDIKWDNDLVFSVGEKMFCVTSLEPPFTCSFKVPEEGFESLSVQPGFKPAPYMARAYWVQVNNDARLSRKEWESFLLNSYSLVKAKLTRKKRTELGID